MDDDGEDVFSGLGSTLGDQILAVVAQLFDRFSSDDVIRVGLDPPVEPVTEHPAIALRDAEHHADGLQRQFSRRLDKIEGSIAAEIHQQSLGPPAKLVFETADPARGESRVHETAQAAVMGIVGLIEEVARPPIVFQLGAAELALPSAFRREERGVQQHIEDVGVTADDPKALAVGGVLRGLVPIDRLVLAQPGEGFVRKASAEGGFVGQIEQGGSHDLFYPGTPHS